MRRLAKTALKVSAVILMMIVAAVASVVALTDPDPKTLPRRIGRGLARWAERSTAPASASGRPAAEEKVPLFTDEWIDDSGYLFAVQFSSPVSDPTSLASLRASIEGRGKRGVAALRAKLDALPPDDPATPHHIGQLRMLIGLLMMYDGDFAAAGDQIALARAADPSRSPDFLANLEALQGLAALRRGEVENCVACCNEGSCIFPLEASAIHKRRSGSTEAIEHFTGYLKKRPEDLGVRWLLNVAHMTLGTYPDGVPADLLLPLGRFEDTAHGKRRWPNVSTRVGLDARGESMAGGLLADDFDGDGLIDVLITNVDPTRGPAYFHNRGNGTFEDRTDRAGMADQVLAPNAYQADYDNDGDLDVILLRGGWESPRRPTLLRNRGDATFEDVTAAAGLMSPIASQAGGWADYDNDGLIDLYLAGEDEPHKPLAANRGRLYHNRGDGTFEDVAEKAGVTNERYGKGVSWGDFDGDGRPDLYVSNRGQENRLYRNNGDGTFVDVAPSLGVTGPINGFACWFWDYDNDGRPDIWVNPFDASLSEVIADQVGRPRGGSRPCLYRNLGPEGFRDVAPEVGADRVVLPMGANFGDLDNDGFLDVYLATGKPDYSALMPNLMFRNVEGRRFEDVTATTGTGHLQKGHGVAFADWDRDGDADLFVDSGGASPGDKAHNLLFQNPGHGNHWLTVKLVGTKTNRGAIGAKIRVDLPSEGGRTVSRHRTIGSGGSFGGNPLACTIGLGAARSVATLEVDWPTSRTHQTFRDVPVDRSIEITEGQDGFRTLDAPPIAVK